MMTRNYLSCELSSAYLIKNVFCYDGFAYNENERCEKWILGKANRHIYRCRQKSSGITKYSTS